VHEVPRLVGQPERAPPDRADDQDARGGSSSWANWAVVEPAIFLGLFDSYGKNDSVDVQCELGGRTMVATGLEILTPSE
jgi:hypothetical protein